VICWRMLIRNGLIRQCIDFEDSSRSAGRLTSQLIRSIHMAVRLAFTIPLRRTSWPMSFLEQKARPNTL